MNEKKRFVFNEISKYLNGTSLDVIAEENGGILKFPVYMSSALMDADIEELELSVRAFNCLKRAGCSKVRDLIEKIECKADLMKLRNLGSKSADEIMTQIMCFQYLMLKPEKQKEYAKRIVELNT